MEQGRKGSSVMVAGEAAPRRGGAGALRAAVKAGDLAKIASEAAKGADPDQPDPKERSSSPLALAIAAGRLEVLNVLLACGADPDAPTSCGDPVFAATPLIMACERGGAKAELLAEALLDAGADPNLSAKGSSPLSEAARRRNVGLTKLLLSRGALPAEGATNACPIWWAALNHKEEALVAMSAALTRGSIAKGAGSEAMRLLATLPKNPKNVRCMAALIGAGVAPWFKVRSEDCCALEEAVRGRPEWIATLVGAAPDEPEKFKKIARCVEDMDAKSMERAYGDEMDLLRSEIARAKIEAERRSLDAAAGAAATAGAARLRI